MTKVTRLKPKEVDTPRGVLMDALSELDENGGDVAMVTIMKKDGDNTRLFLVRSKCSYGDTMAMVGYAMERALK